MDGACKVDAGCVQDFTDRHHREVRLSGSYHPGCTRATRRHLEIDLFCDTIKKAGPKPDPLVLPCVYRELYPC